MAEISNVGNAGAVTAPVAEAQTATNFAVSVDDVSTRQQVRDIVVNTSRLPSSALGSAYGDMLAKEHAGKPTEASVRDELQKLTLDPANADAARNVSDGFERGVSDQAAINRMTEVSNREPVFNDVGEEGPSIPPAQQSGDLLHSRLSA